jgi:hypothetical protein
MKTRNTKILTYFLAIFLLTSCAGLHNGYMNNSTALSEANFSYVKNDIRGTSTATYVFGIGGMKKQTLVDEAKKNMLSNPLGRNQALVNQTVNFKYAFYLGIVTKVTCTVTADVVEFA